MGTKFLTAVKDFGFCKANKNEFIIPNFFSESVEFIGLESLKSCQYGLIVYTGKEIGLADVLEKLKTKEIQPPIESKITEFLDELREFKIGHIVELGADFHLRLTSLKIIDGNERKLP